LIGGVWRPEPELLKSIREKININSEELRDILSEKKLVKQFELR
jgi:hypothetical protein